VSVSIDPLDHPSTCIWTAGLGRAPTSSGWKSVSGSGHSGDQHRTCILLDLAPLSRPECPKGNCPSCVEGDGHIRAIPPSTSSININFELELGVSRRSTG
jgi:hypothetical protein